MKIAILSRLRRSYSTRRLRDAAIERGHDATVLNTLKFSIILEKQKPSLYYAGQPLDEFDAVIPRIGPAVTFFGVAVVRQFEQMGVYVANDSMAISRSRDKLRAIQTLSRYDIGIPPTVFARDKNDILPDIERVGGPPVIIKVLEGTQGVGVILAENTSMAEAIVQTLQGAKQNVLIQKFIEESKGRDIRALVVGDRVVAAMRRTAQPGEFRSNVHRGGSTKAMQLDTHYESTAIRAAQIMGLRVAGVDMLETASGPQVLEVNSSPGLEGIEKATAADVAGAIIADIEQQVLFPEVDLKQKLRLTGGYGIAEFTVHDMPGLEGKAIRHTGLAARKIYIMSITRQLAIIPNPRGDELIQRGDVLLCYGNLHDLRSLMPEKRDKRNRRGPKRIASGKET